MRFCTRQNFHATTLAEILFLAFCLLFPLGYVCASLISALSCSSTSCIQSVSYFCCYFCPIVCSSWSSSSSHACGSSGLCVFFFALLSPVCSNYCKKFLAPIVFPFASSSLIITSSVLTLYSIFICLWAFPALDLPLPALSYSASIHSLLKLLLFDCHVIHLAFRVRKTFNEVLCCWNVPCFCHPAPISAPIRTLYLVSVAWHCFRMNVPDASFVSSRQVIRPSYPLLPFVLLSVLAFPLLTASPPLLHVLPFQAFCLCPWVLNFHFSPGHLTRP